ncbi:MAG: DNA-binding protein [Ruminococcus sp.]|nr:DNA-binding protein [Ruminococcus sp.]
MSKDLQVVLLLDCYGAMLTEHQSQMMRQYYDEDLSLREIADLAGITRQGVHDTIRRGEQYLREMEAQLHLVEKLRAIRRNMIATSDTLRQIAAVSEDAEVLALCEQAQRLTQEGIDLTDLEMK